MIALVTGPAGFIGSHLCESLLDDGDQVVAGLLYRQLPPRLKARTGRCCARVRRVHLHQGGPCRGGDRAVAQGCRLRVPHRRPALAFARRGDLTSPTTCAITSPPPSGSWRHANTARSASSCTVRVLRSTATPSPFRHLSPSGPNSISLVIGVTKLTADAVRKEAYGRSFGIPVAALRLFTVVRPQAAARHGLLPPGRCGALRRAVRDLWGWPPTRDFTFVGDVVQALRDAARSPWCGLANIGGGSRRSLNDAVEIIGELLGQLAHPSSAGGCGRCPRHRRRHIGGRGRLRLPAADFAAGRAGRDGSHRACVRRGPVTRMRGRS